MEWAMSPRFSRRRRGYTARSPLTQKSRQLSALEFMLTMFLSLLLIGLILTFSSISWAVRTLMGWEPRESFPDRSFRSGLLPMVDQQPQQGKSINESMTYSELPSRSRVESFTLLRDENSQLIALNSTQELASNTTISEAYFGFGSGGQHDN